MAAGFTRQSADHSPQAVRRKAMDLLARREHAVSELQQKLVAKGYPPECVTPVIQELEQEGLLSDDRFTEAYVRYRAERGYGPIRIQAELRERGVGEEIQDAYLDFKDPRWRERIAQVRSKRFGGDLPADFQERGRQARFLQYRGFTSEQTRQALDQDWD